MLQVVAFSVADWEHIVNLQELADLDPDLVAWWTLIALIVFEQLLNFLSEILNVDAILVKIVFNIEFRQRFEHLLDFRGSLEHLIDRQVI